MGRHYCVAVLFLVCALHLVDNYQVIQNFERRTENGDTELHTRIARHVRGWHRGPKGKRGKWRHYNAINDNKATADHSGRAENGKESGVSVDEGPDNFDIWGGETPNGHHDWSNNEGDRHHLDHGPGRRRGKGQRKGKRKNRWNANHRSYDKYWERHDNIRGGDESEVSDKDKHGTDWWTDFWGNDENKHDRLEGDQKDFGHWGHGDKESHKPHHKDKDENNWWNELWGCDKKGSGKHGDKTNWWDDLWGNDEDDDSWWDNLLGKDDEESETDWWSDLWGNDKEGNDWSGNDDDSFSWWDDLWGNGESESHEFDEDDDEWLNNLWDNDDKHHNSWITDEWFNDSRGHDNKDSAENGDDHFDWLDDLLTSDEKATKEMDDNGHDWWSDWWKPDVEDSQSDEQDYLSMGDGEDTNFVDDLSGHSEKETDWWNDFWGNLFGLNDKTAKPKDVGEHIVGNLNGSPVVRPNNDINYNTNNPENTNETVDEDSDEPNDTRDEDKEFGTLADDYSDEFQDDDSTESSKHEADHTEDSDMETDIESADENMHGNTGYGNPVGVNTIDAGDKDDSGSVSGHTALSQSGSFNSGVNSNHAGSKPVGGNYGGKPDHFGF